MFFFHLIFPCANIFFVVRPARYKLSNGPSLRPWETSIAYVTIGEREGAGYGKLEVDHG